VTIKNAFLLGMTLASVLPLAATAQTRAAITALPSGFSLSHGVGTVSLSGIYTPDGRRKIDGDMGLALGFGDPVNAVGFAISADITSLENDFADSGYLNLSLHRQFRMSRGYGSVNATVSGIGAYGTASGRDVGGSLVASFVTGTAARPYMITLGIANDLTFAQDIDGIFGLGVGLSNNWAISAGVYGDNNALGVTYFPPFLPNAVVQVSLRNLDDRATRGIGVDIGYAFNLFGN